MKYYLDVLRKYAVFDGRARRKEYWMFCLWNFLIILIAAALYAILSGILIVVFSSSVAGLVIVSGLIFRLITWVYYLAILLPSLAVTIRRIHDIGKSGWWILIGFVPFIGAIVLLVFAVMDSQPGTNQYGPNPKEVPTAGPDVPQKPATV